MIEFVILIQISSYYSKVHHFEYRIHHLRLMIDHDPKPIRCVEEGLLLLKTKAHIHQIFVDRKLW